MTPTKMKAMTGMLLASMGIGAGPLHAELTAAELLDEWQRTGESVGVVIEWESMEETADGLMLSGFSEVSSLEGQEFRVNADWLRLSERADGSVSVGFPGTMPIEWKATTGALFKGELSTDDAEFLANRDSSRLTMNWDSGSLVVQGLLETQSGDLLGTMLAEVEAVEAASSIPAFGGGTGLSEGAFRADSLSLTFHQFSTDLIYTIKVGQPAVTVEAAFPDPGQADDAFPFSHAEVTLGLERIVAELTQGTAESDFAAFLNSGPGHFSQNSRPGSVATESSISDLEVSVEINGTDRYSVGTSVINSTSESTDLTELERFRTGFWWEVESIRLSQEAMDRIDPSGLIPNPAGRFAGEVSVTMPAQWADAMPYGGSDTTASEPGLLEIELEVHEIDLFGLSLNANGELSHDNAQDLTMGALAVEVGGLPELIEAATQAGLIEDELRLFLQVVLAMGEQTDDGKLVYDIEFLGPEGFRVNGLPI